MDYEIYKLRENLISELNKANLPVEVKRMIVAELLAIVSEASIKAIEEQKMEVLSDGNSNA